MIKGLWVKRFIENHKIKYTVLKNVMFWNVKNMSLCLQSLHYSDSKQSYMSFTFHYTKLRQSDELLNRKLHVFSEFLKKTVLLNHT